VADRASKWLLAKPFRSLLESGYTWLQNFYDSLRRTAGWVGFWARDLSGQYVLSIGYRVDWGEHIWSKFECLGGGLVKSPCWVFGRVLGYEAYLERISYLTIKRYRWMVSKHEFEANLMRVWLVFDVSSWWRCIIVGTYLGEFDMNEWGCRRFTHVEYDF